MFKTETVKFHFSQFFHNILLFGALNDEMPLFIEFANGILLRPLVPGIVIQGFFAQLIPPL